MSVHQLIINIKTLNKSTEINKLVIDIYYKSNKRAGYRAIKSLLKTQYDLIVNHKKIYKIMKENNIQSIIRKKYKNPKEQTIVKENLLNRDFSVINLGRSL